MTRHACCALYVTVPRVATALPAAGLPTSHDYRHDVSGAYCVARVGLQERHALSGPMCVGFIPVISGKSSKIAQARLRLYQFCMSTLIQDLKTASCGLRFHAHFGKLSAALALVPLVASALSKAPLQ